MSRFLAAWIFIIGAVAIAQAQMLAPIVNFGKPRTSGGCSQATALIAAMDGSENAAAVTTAICGMVTDGTLAKLDILYVFGTGSRANAVVNWVNPGTFNATQEGTNTQCSYSATNGFTGDAANCYINSNYSPGTNGTHYTSTSASLGVCLLGTTDLNTIASTRVAGLGLGFFANSSTGIAYLVNDNTYPLANIGASYAGSTIASNNAGTTVTLYRNGSSFTSATPGSTFSLINPFVMLADSNNGTISAFSADTIDYAFIGGFLTGADVGNIYNRMHTYLSAIGASAGC